MTEPMCCVESAHDNFWDFISRTPESLHMIMWHLSDRNIPRSLRYVPSCRLMFHNSLNPTVVNSMMQGFGVHTFICVNAKGERSFVKFHWKPKLGIHSLVWDEALKISGQDPDFHRRDLWDAIEVRALIYIPWLFEFGQLKNDRNL